MALKIIRGEFARFLLAGAANTLLTYLLYLLLLEFLTYLLAYSITYCTGIALSYFMNVYLVFKQRASFASFVKFPIVYVIQYSLGAAILWLLVDMADVSPAIAMIGVIAATVPVTFIAIRFMLSK